MNWAELHRAYTRAVLNYAVLGRKLNQAKRYARKRKRQLQREIEELVIEALEEVISLVFEYDPENGWRVLGELQAHLSAAKREVIA